jgi:hypothetical protein
LLNDFRVEMQKWIVIAVLLLASLSPFSSAALASANDPATMSASETAALPADAAVPAPEIARFDLAQAHVPDLPDGWKLAPGSADQGYQALTVKDRKTGEIAACIKAGAPGVKSIQKEGFLLAPSIDMSACRGKSVEISCYLRATGQDEDSGAEVFYLCENATSPEHLGDLFADESQFADRKIDKTVYAFSSSEFSNCDWQNIHLSSKPVEKYGRLTVAVRLKGKGEAWIKGIVVKELSSSAEEMPVVEKASNLDLSEGKIGNLPLHWFLGEPVGSRNYRAVLQDLPEGGRCVSLSSLPNKTSERAIFFQRFSAVPYRDKHLVLEADMKADLKQSLAAARLFISPGTRQLGLYNDKRQNQPVIGDSWNHYRAEADVLADCKEIDMGMELFGAGCLLIKNARLTVAGPAAVGNQPAAPLSEKEAKCLRAFARLFGYMRFFDPAVDRSAYWWNQYAVWAVAEIIKKAPSAGDVLQVLRDVSAPVDPSLKILLAQEKPEEKSTGGDSQPVCRWEHHGYGVEPGSVNAGYLSRITESGEDRTATPAATVESRLRLPLNDELVCLVNQSCRSNQEAAPVAAMLAASHPDSWTANGNDRPSRLAAVIVAWNAYRHFYPYADLVSVDWVGALDKALKQASRDRDKSEFYHTLSHLVAALGDDQARAFCDDIEGVGIVSTQYTAPCILQMLDDGKIIAATPRRNEYPNGLVVSHIASQPVSELLASKEEIVSAATPQWRRYRALQLLQTGSLYSEFSFSDRESSPGKKHELSSRSARSVPFVTTVSPAGIMTSHLLGCRPEKIHFLTPEVLYIDLTRVNLKELQAALVQARQVRGVVFDCRGELRLPTESFLGSLSDREIPSPRFLLPVITRPDMTGVSFEPVNFTCKPHGPRVGARSVFVADESSVGNMEAALSMVKNSRLGTIVGKPTAGTAGGIALAALPGNYFVTWTCFKTLKPDGSRMHGVGIEPDKPGKITREGICAGRDELLEAALKELGRE